MLALSAKEAKYGFVRLIDLARSSPVAILKHGRPVVVVMAVEEFERLTAETQTKAPQNSAGPKAKKADPHPEGYSFITRVRSDYVACPTLRYHGSS